MTPEVWKINGEIATINKKLEEIESKLKTLSEQKPEAEIQVSEEIKVRLEWVENQLIALKEKSNNQPRAKTKPNQQKSEI